MGERAQEPPPTTVPPSEGYADVSRSHLLLNCDVLERKVIFPLPPSLILPPSPFLPHPSPSQVPLSVPSQPATPAHGTQTVTESLSTIEAGIESLSVNSTGTGEGDPHQVTPPTLPDTLTPAPVTIVRTPSPANQKQSQEFSGHPPHLHPEVAVQTQPNSVAQQPPVSVALQRDGQSHTQSAPLGQPTTVTMATSYSLAGQPVPTPQGVAAPPHTSGIPAHRLQPNSYPHESPALQTTLLSSTLSTTHPAYLPGSVPSSYSIPPQQPPPTAQATPSLSAPLMTGAAPLSGLPTAPPTISLPSIAPTISLGPTPFLPSPASSNSTQ